MISQETTQAIVIYLSLPVSVLTGVYIYYTIKKQLVKLKKKRLIREFKHSNQEYHNWLNTSTHLENVDYLRWDIIDSNFYIDLKRIKVEYRELK